MGSGRSDWFHEGAIAMLKWLVYDRSVNLDRGRALPL